MLTAILPTPGGEEGEVAISQEECTGEVGGTAPFTSTKHIARYSSFSNSSTTISTRCGFLNVYSFDSDGCQIDAMPDIPPENEPCMPDCAPPSPAP